VISWLCTARQSQCWFTFVCGLDASAQVTHVRFQLPVDELVGEHGRVRLHIDLEFPAGTVVTARLVSFAVEVNSKAHTNEQQHMQQQTRIAMAATVTAATTAASTTAATAGTTAAATAAELHHSCNTGRRQQCAAANQHSSKQFQLEGICCQQIRRVTSACIRVNAWGASSSNTTLVAYMTSWSFI
jgi:hypothetical protein